MTKTIVDGRWIKEAFVNGNNKLDKSHLIFNMGSAHDCPSKALGLCKVGTKHCYAHRDEVTYPSVLPFRRWQKKVWEQATVQEMYNEIDQIVKRRRKSSPTIKYLRINEAGDFVKQSDVEKASALAQMLKDNLNITTYMYTARKDLDFTGVAFVLNGSSWMAHNEFRYIPKGETPLPVMCPGDCGLCNLCKEAKGLVIGVAQH